MWAPWSVWTHTHTTRTHKNRRHENIVPIASSRKACPLLCFESKLLLGFPYLWGGREKVYGRFNPAFLLEIVKMWAISAFDQWNHKNLNLGSFWQHKEPLDWAVQCRSVVLRREARSQKWPFTPLISECFLFPQAPFFPFKDLIYFMPVCVCLHVCNAHAVPMEARGGHPILGNRSYRKLGVPTWSWEPAGFLTRAESAFHLWAPPINPWSVFLFIFS